MSSSENIFQRIPSLVAKAVYQRICVVSCAQVCLFFCKKNHWLFFRANLKNMSISRQHWQDKWINLGFVIYYKRGKYLNCLENSSLARKNFIQFLLSAYLRQSKQWIISKLPLRHFRTPQNKFSRYSHHVGKSSAHRSKQRNIYSGLFNIPSEGVRRQVPAIFSLNWHVFYLWKPYIVLLLT